MGAAPDAAGRQFLLREDPGDPAPLGTRTPLVLVHGFDTDHTPLPFSVGRNDHWDPFRREDRQARHRDHYKPFVFEYRPFLALEEIGRGLAEALRAELLPRLAADRKVVFGAISAGALVTRYAAAERDLVDRTEAILTLNGANRGVPLVSLLFGNARLGARIGRVFSYLLRQGRGTKVLSPGLRSLAFDNFDDSISARCEEEFEVLVNHPLRRFNEEDPNLGKITAFQARARGVLRGGRFPFENHMRRVMLRRYSPTWADVDPLVHLDSGLLRGAEIASRRVFDDLDHWGIQEPPVLDALDEELARLRYRAENP